MKRILRIGLPSGMESLLSWLANFAVVIVVNKMDRTSVAAAAHINAVRLESVSYLGGFAVATAAAALVGQSLGAGDPRRARRAAYLAYVLGGGWMVVMGLSFIFFPRFYASLISEKPDVIACG
jgi:Na+-driven multidrug efflux pump